MRWLSIFFVLLGATKGMAAEKFDVYGDGRYGRAGCGLGSLLFGPKEGPVQILAATFNVTSGTQTFGITFGTSNCGSGIFKAAQLSFVDYNFATLEKEVGQGEGQTVTAYAALLGCKVKDYQTFSAKLQQHHAEIFYLQTTEACLIKTQELVHSDPLLRESCSEI